MEFIFSILSLVVSFFNFVLVLRTWLEFCRVDPQLSISQTLIRLTQPLITPVNKVVPHFRNLNVSALIIAAAFTSLFIWLVGNPISIAIIVGILSVIKTFGQILFFTILIRALMSWVTQGSHPLDRVIYQITEPALGLVRKFLPKTGMLDFSVMALTFILLLLNGVMLQYFDQLWVAA